METIGNTIKSFEPDFDFGPVIREWASEIPKELDFRDEVQEGAALSYLILSYFILSYLILSYLILSYFVL